MRLRSRSLAGRMATLILLGAGLVLLTLLSLNYIYQRRSILDTAVQEGAALTQSVVYQIESEFGRAEALVRQTALLLKEKPFERLACEDVIRRTLEDNPLLLGMAIALSPKEAEQSDFKILYGWRERNAVQVHDRKHPLQDYQHDWFHLPYYLRTPVWIEPYYDQDAQAMMVTYSVPAIREGEVAAVVTCDLSLGMIRALLNGLSLGEEGLAVLLSQRGAFISHPNHQLEMNETIFSYAESMEDPEEVALLTQLGRDMISGVPGRLFYQRPATNEPSCIFYHAVPCTGWAFGVIKPERQVLAPLTRLNRMSALVALVGLALLLIPALGIAWSVATPLRRLTAAAQRIATGDFDTPLPAVRTRDEVAQLTGSFEQMRRDLRRYVADLTATTAAKERIVGELSAAREIQMGIVPKLFPPFPERSEIDLYAVLIPAQEVGGDLYDFALLDEDHLYVAIGDVSGKGIAASLLMAVGKTLLKSAIQSVRAPARALAQVNNELAEDNESCMFITLFCGILNIKTGDFIYANAGHNAPFLTRRSGHIECLDEAPSAPLGVRADMVYHDRVRRLDPDNLLVLYTDGVTEAMNQDKVMFGEATLLDYIQREGGKGARPFIEGLAEAVRKHANGEAQSDDITALAVRCCSRTDSHSQPLNKTIPVQRDPDAAVSLRNDLKELARLTEWLEAQAAAMDLPPAWLMSVNLALEEWLVNVISYAYVDELEHAIELRLWRNEKDVVIQIEDDGQPFDPTAQAEADTSMPLEHRQIGGLGIHFIRKTMDRFTYAREQERNIVTLTKTIADNPA